MRKLLVTALAIASLRAEAQVDPHFSQYYAYPLWLNPAMTGTSASDYRASALYRNQWNGLGGGFSTIGVSADAATGRNMSLGVNLLRQTAGTGGYQYTSGSLSAAYSGVRWGKEEQHHLSIALQAGFLSRRFDPSKLQGGDQWTAGVGFDPSRASGDPLTNTSAASFDAAVGLLYYNSLPDARVNPFFGLSAGHLTRPEDPFVGRGAASRLPLRYTAHGGARVRVSEDAWLVPNALVLQQGSATEIVGGAYAQWRVQGKTELVLGANYRVQDAIVPFAAVVHGNLMIGASYDVNSSRLGKMANGANSFELSLTFLGRRKASLAPHSFVCPRL